MQRVGFIALSMDELAIDGKVVMLTNDEHRALRLLLRQSGSVVTRTALKEVTWGDTTPGRNAELDHLIDALRAKLRGGGVTLHTVPGIGYMLTQP